MSTVEPIFIGRGERPAYLLPGLANRHGLVAGATGTGKTVTLQALAEGFSARGVPVFVADVKGDLAGLSQPGGQKPRIIERAKQLGVEDFAPAACPVAFWDVFGQQGHPLRATISEMGPLLLARLLNLNETQAGVLNLVFKLADEQGLLLLDLKDLRAMVQWVGGHAAGITTTHGNVSAASLGAIQRGLLTLGQQGGDRFFGEPALNLEDLLQTDAQGRGVVNILAADQLMMAPKVYATMLLWLLSELFENLPEVGDVPKPKLVFFFDEAHLLFTDAPEALLGKIELVVRLIRSKGVGVYFVTQNPQDVPDKVLGQLGHRVQHALRAFTPRDQKAVRAAAETFRPNPKLNTEEVLTSLGVGEALVSCLDEQGQPEVVERVLVCPPRSQLGPVTPEQRLRLMQVSLVAGVYDQPLDRESAYEMLAAAHAAPVVARPPAAAGPKVVPLGRAPTPRAPGRQPESIGTAMAKSVARTMGSTLTREIMRGLLGGIFGGRRR